MPITPKDAERIRSSDNRIFKDECDKIDHFLTSNSPDNGRWCYDIEGLSTELLEWISKTYTVMGWKVELRGNLLVFSV